MYYKICQICGLRSGRLDGQKRTFLAKFPLNEERCKKWVKVTGKEDLAYVPIEKLHQLKTICSNHFLPKDFKKKKTQLKKTAVPSIGLTAEPLADELLIGFPLHIKTKQKDVTEPSPHIAIEHNYCDFIVSGADNCSGSNESVSESATQEKGDGKTIINKCVLCDKKGITPSSEQVLSRFPLNPAICRTWVKRVGLKELLSIPIEKLNKTMFLCQKHFDPGCFKKDNLRILTTPCIDLYYPPLPEEMMSVFCTEDQTGSLRFPTGSKAENINLSKYPEEDLCANADIFENSELNDDYGSPNVEPTIETTLSIDEIDNLFASYSVTFRKFPSKLQTMLKLDLAKLFARYEMKNAALQCSSDEEQQDDTPSTILLEKTKRTEKRLKRNFSQPQPYITTNNPAEILTHSKSMMPKSQVSNKDTEGAVNESSSKKNKLLNKKAIIKKRVTDTRDHDNIVLQTSDQYQKPMKVRKLEEDNVDADTSRSLSNSQDSQGTSAILITDRSSKKLTTVSDNISQSQKSAS